MLWVFFPSSTSKAPLSRQTSQLLPPQTRASSSPKFQEHLYSSQSSWCTLVCFHPSPLGSSGNHSMRHFSSRRAHLSAQPPATHHPQPFPSLHPSQGWWFWPREVPQKYLFAPEQQRPPLCSWNCSIGVGCRVLLGGGSFKTLPTCLSGAEGTLALVTLIYIPSSWGSLTGRGKKNSCWDQEREQRELLALHPHIYSHQQWSLAGPAAISQGTANTSAEHSVECSLWHSSGKRIGQVLEALLEHCQGQHKDNAHVNIWADSKRWDSEIPGEWEQPQVRGGSGLSGGFLPAPLPKWGSGCHHTPSKVTVESPIGDHIKRQRPNQLWEFRHMNFHIKLSF